MGQFLTFAMVAPMASFGTLAVGERRDGSDRPARSAVLGLVGACLGLTRDDEDAQKDLAHQYGLAVLCHASGRLLTDYHTTQTAPARRNWTPATRAQELADAPGEIATILSRRDYRMGSWHLGVLWVRADMPRWSLDSIKMAMQQPVFSPSLGRKSCPPGLPLAPDIQSADNAITAVLDRYKHGPEQSVQTRFGLFKNHLTGPDTQTDVVVVMDTADVAAHGGNYPVVRHEMRRDQPLSRTRWQFGLREEAMLLCKKDIAI